MKKCKTFDIVNNRQFIVNFKKQHHLFVKLSENVFQRENINKAFSD
jgi:hypothetical protein